MRLDGRLLFLVLLALTLSASAQTPKKAQPATKVATRAATSTPQPTTQLPVTRVSLYKNGVGFFEHAGQVNGDQSVTVDFTSAQLDDVLQSLTAIDLGGGRISGAGYNSTTPLDQQLKTLSLGLDESPTADEFYNAIRGARVEVSGNGLPIIGRILSMEVRRTGLDTEDEKKPTGEKRTLTVVSDLGSVRSIDLTASTQVRLLDSTLHGDVNRYLEMIDTNRNQGLRHLTLHDAGTGARDLHISYISEVPIWKSTYRILFTDANGSTPQSTTLQGWSVVDNTTGEDWNNVHLSLIAGAPQSFLQPLSTPLYSRRPEVPISETAQLTPQTHESGEALLAPTKLPRSVSADMNAVGRVMDGEGLGAVSNAGVARMYGTGAGSGGSVGGGFMGGTIAPSSYQSAAAASITPTTTTHAFDDFFEYQIAQPITIRKNESALVPILQSKIDAERVTLWYARQPLALRALWITNTSNLTLDRGSFSIVENGDFAGEGLLDPIHPKERRLLSYAADEAVRVVHNSSTNQRIQAFTVTDGVLWQTSLDSRVVNYIVSNAADAARSVIVEHPVEAGWTTDKNDVKAEESTGTVSRYRVAVEPRTAATLTIHESSTVKQSWRLTNISDSQFGLILKNAKPNPALIAVLQPILDARHAVAELDKQIKDKQTVIDTLVKDQDRLRSNLTALKSTQEERALATRYTHELDTQEDQLATMRKDLDTLKEKQTAAAADLSQKIQSARIDERL